MCTAAGCGRLQLKAANGYFGSITASLQVVDNFDKRTVFEDSPLGTSLLYYYYYFKKLVMQGWDRAIITLSVRRSEPHNTNT